MLQTLVLCITSYFLIFILQQILHYGIHLRSIYYVVHDEKNENDDQTKKKNAFDFENKAGVL